MDSRQHRQQFRHSPLRTWDNGGAAIHLAPATFDAFFILHHAVRHMTVGGIGFRQLCDWTMYLHKHHQDIDNKLLQEKLETYRMMEVWNEFGILAVTILGLPVEELPLAPSFMESSKTEKILRQIFISGNFGHADGKRRKPGKTSYLIKKWRDFRFQISRLLMLFNLFPKFALSYAAGWISGGIERILRHK